MHQGILASMELWRHDANTAGALLVMCAALVVGPSTAQGANEHKSGETTRG